MGFQLAGCQIMVGDSKEENVKNAELLVNKAAAAGAQVVALPEMFVCPYSRKAVMQNKEPADGATVESLSRMAEKNGVYLIGGSIAEQAGDAVYNTCFCFDPKGKLIGRHRKTHLFDVDIKGGIRFIESEMFRAGESRTVIETEFCKIGIGICYDVRFPEYFREMALDGVKLAVLPASFNMTTGPAHWELTMRARALDNQVYFAAVSPARNLESSYHSYGHSCVVNPFGQLCGKLDERQGIVYADIDLDYLQKVRTELPLLAQRRPELYGSAR